MRRFVVVGRDGEYAVGTEIRKLACKGNHFCRVIAARPCENRDLSLGKFNGDLHNAKVLFVCERGTLSRSSAWNQEVDACVDLPLD